MKPLYTSGIFFLGALLQIAAICCKLYDLRSHIWSLAIRVNRAFCDKIAISASILLLYK